MNVIQISHYINEFLAFYRSTQIPHLEEKGLFNLWKKHYGFNPYLKEDPKNQLAKEMVKRAFPKYRAVVPKIEQFQPNEEKIMHLVSLVQDELQCYEPLHLSVVFFVGDFDTDPFIEKATSESYILYFPIEKQWQDVHLAQELAKAIYLNQTKANPYPPKNIAHAIFMEGLSLHTAIKITSAEFQTTALYPWMSSCNKEPNRIMINLLPHTRRTDYKALYSFTKGTGASGYLNEASFAGWNVVHHLLRNDDKLSELVEIPDSKITSLVEQTLHRVIEESTYIS
ncbi:hypothetical protein [Halobacillus sp. Marseille-Q1614]|uniref:hypothetical protein n=1 Tax=Halobacillus sp. Marseille-Q1614 TaxID=2709134 RepID=UPI00156E5E5E|nr:hypothetical protein [Halobacillus sp. Marseille-Q1614]